MRSASTGPRTDRNTQDEGGAAERRLFFDAYALTASTISSAAAGFVTYILLARLFPQATVGEAAGLTSAMLLLSGAAQLDMSNALHRFLPGSGRSARALIAGTYAVVFVASLLLTVIFVLVFGELLFGDDLVGPLVWFSLSVAAWSLFNLQDQVLMGLGASLLVPIENTLFGLARIGLLIAVVGGSAYAIFATWIIPVAVLFVVVSVLIAVKVFPAHVVRSEASPTRWTRGQVVRFAAAGYPGGLAGLATSNILPLLVLAELGSEANGAFYIAWVICTTVDLVAMNFGISVVVQGATSPSHVRRLLAAALKRQFLLIGPGLVVLVLFARPILTIVFGEEYASAAPLLQLLAIGLIPRMVWGMYLPYVRLKGRIRAMAITQILAAVLLLACTWVGLTTGGLTGIGYGFLATHGLMFLLLGRELWKMLHDDTRPAPTPATEVGA